MTKTIGRYPAQVIIFPTPSNLTTITSTLDSAIIPAATTITINRQDQLNQPVTVTLQEMYQANMTQASEAAVNETKTGLTATADVTLAADKLHIFAKAFNSPLVAQTGLSVTSLTNASQVATATTATPHNYSVNDTVTIAGATGSALNGTFVITSVPSTTTFTYTITGTPTSPDTGSSITVVGQDYGLLKMSDDGGNTFGSSNLPFYTVVIRPYLGASPTVNPSLYVIFPFGLSSCICSIFLLCAFFGGRNE